MCFSLLHSVTAFISSKRAHYHPILLAGCLCFKTTPSARSIGPRCGQLRYVFCGFYPNFHDFHYGFLLFSLMPSVTSLVSSKRAHYHAINLVWFIVENSKPNEVNSRTMWSVTLRLLWFLTLFFLILHRFYY